MTDSIKYKQKIEVIVNLYSTYIPKTTAILTDWLSLFLPSKFQDNTLK
jgi:hypothetical protein